MMAERDPKCSHAHNVEHKHEVMCAASVERSCCAPRVSLHPAVLFTFPLLTTLRYFLQIPSVGFFSTRLQVDQGSLF